MTVSAEAQKIIAEIQALKADTHTQAEIDAAAASATAAATAAAAAQDTEDFTAIEVALAASPVTPSLDGTPPAETSTVVPADGSAPGGTATS